MIKHYCFFMVSATLKNFKLQALNLLSARLLAS